MVVIRSSVLLVIVFIMKMTLAGSDIQITFTPSPNTPNIAEGDTAVYNCTSNHSSVGIIWYFNGTVPALSLTSLGVTITGPGSTVSSLSVPGLVDPFNNTNVSCFASGPVAGNVSSPLVPLRVQGPPGAVVDISVNFSSCTYYISWTAPFTLSGFPILQYNINVTNGTAVIYKTDAEWSYSPVEFGNHSVSIAAVNSVGEGERSTINQKTDRYTINNVTCADRYRDSINNWIIVLHIEVSTVTECIDVVTVTCVDTAVSVNTSNITVTATGQLTATLNTSLLDDKYYTFTTDLLHANGLQVNDNKPLRLSFFDVSNFSILSIESNTVTFMCDFVRGSQAIGCHISLNDSLINTTYSINITREIRTGSISVPAGNYSISVFDINEDNSIPISAVFTSTVVIATATSTISPTSSSGSTSSSSPSQTVNGNNNTATDLADIIAGIVGGAIIGSIFIAVIVLVIVAGCYIKTRKTNVNAVIRKETRENKKTTPSQHDIQLIYIDVEHGPNAPMAPPPFDPNPAPYSDVIIPIPHQREHIDGTLYDQQLFADNSNQLHSTLNSNATTIDSGVADYYSQDSATTTSITTISDDYLPDSEHEYITQTKLTHRALSEHVAPHLTNKWREVRSALALTPPQLDDIEENHQGISDVFQMWEELETHPFNWETLLTILRSSGVNECELADQLERHASKS